MLKYSWEKHQEGKRVFWRCGGTERNLRVNEKAMKKYQKWLEDKADNVSRDHDPFEIIFDEY